MPVCSLHVQAAATARLGQAVSAPAPSGERHSLMWLHHHFCCAVLCSCLVRQMQIHPVSSDGVCHRHERCTICSMSAIITLHPVFSAESLLTLASCAGVTRPTVFGGSLPALAGIPQVIPSPVRGLCCLLLAQSCQGHNRKSCWEPKCLATLDTEACIYAGPAAWHCLPAFCSQR